MHEPLDRRTFLAATSASLAGAAFAQDASPELPTLTHGPFRCDGGKEVFHVWARASKPGEYVLHVDDPWELNPQHFQQAAHATEDNDLTLRWVIGAERAHVLYDICVKYGGRIISCVQWAPRGQEWTQSSWAVAFASCADERKFAEQPAWTRMSEARHDLLVLLGDTPYIDTTNLTVQRERYRAFYAQPQFAQLAQRVPFVGTWDDHDYAGNDRFGAVEGRESSRRAFLEYHGPGEWGENGQGIYTRRRIGPIEVFLLDTRWFADTEPSTFDAAKKTLLGAAQWGWLQKGLEASDAPFKVLACGMIWNDAVRPMKRDYWGAWPHEREGLFRWLGEKKIAGVVLVSGDIHRTRAIQHATKDVVGYDIVELTTSPLANSVIEAANAQHPGLLFDVGVEQSYLALSANTEGSARLLAGFYDHTGKKLFELERLAATLSRR